MVKVAGIEIFLFMMLTVESYLMLAMSERLMMMMTVKMPMMVMMVMMGSSRLLTNAKQFLCWSIMHFAFIVAQNI
jgi:hypothetical protein